MSVPRILAALIIAGLCAAPTAAARHKPSCIGLYLPATSQLNCRLNLPIAPMALFAATVNLKATNRDLKLGGTTLSDRRLVLRELRGADQNRIYDWARTARSDRIRAALAGCFIGAAFGAVMGIITGLITGNLTPLLLASTSVGGCVSDMLKPSQDAARQALARKLRLGPRAR